jgi:serine/threonine protein kinase
MERTTFLGHYRICVNGDGAPQELGRAGPAITYKAVDEWSGEPVVLKLIPIGNIDPEAQEQFEEQARPAQQLHHINIAKVLDFGKEAGQFVYVSEYLEGETVDSWIEEHGPMPPDAVLRVAAQVVSALSAASFHRLTHRAIQPSNLLIVPGPTAEGGWPFVKLMDVSSAGRKLHSHQGEAPDVDSSVARQFASPEQLQHGTVDFRSAIYSLGATMYFLLTGAAPPAKVHLRELRRFPKALRNLLAHMLRGNPDKRPQDLVALAESIRECLLRIERRQEFARRLGIPLAAVIPREPKTPPTPLAQVLRGILVVAALLLAVGAVGAFLLPNDINPFRHLTTAKHMIGVPIGVPDTSPSAPSQATNSASVANLPLTNASPSLENLNQNPSSDIQQAQTSNARPAADSSPTNAASPSSTGSAQIASAALPSESATPSQGPRDRSTLAESSGQEQDTSSAQANVAPQPTAASESSSPSKNETVTSTSTRLSKRTGVADMSPDGQPRGPAASTRAQFVGITSDGRLIFRLPSGRRTIVAPDSDEDEFVPQRHRRH